MRSLVLIKPDGVEKNVIGDILSIYEKNNLKILELKMMKVSREFAKKHYEEHNGKPFFEKLIDFVTRGPLVALILEGGDDVVGKVRSLNGNTDPSKAEEGTIRALYGTDKTENCVHSSDSPENAKKEIELWFN